MESYDNRTEKEKKNQAKKGAETKRKNQNGIK